MNKTNKKTTISARQMALETLVMVLDQKKSLNNFFHAKKQKVDPIDQALFHNLVYEGLRQYKAISLIRDQLLNEEIPKGQNLLPIILNLGLLQLLTMNLGDHGVINETVNLASRNKIPRYKGLINAILRKAQSKKNNWQDFLIKNQTSNLPKYLVRTYPKHIKQLSQALNQPPLTLRLNPTINRSDWINQNEGAIANPISNQAITLIPARPVTKINDFAQGKVCVQDATAQLAGELLAPKNNEKILDACAAPGGKTIHLLDIAPNCDLTAIEIDKQRIIKINENLKRTNHKAKIKQADLRNIEAWYENELFDAILLDAPCSASGVLRRNPDILFTRKSADFAKFAKIQQELLETSWQLLVNGGRLLYVTCSLIPQENQHVIRQFLAKNSDAYLTKISIHQGIDTGFGTVRLPDEYGDGFFFALLKKTN